VADKSKKQLILERARARGLERAGEREIRAIEADLRREFGAEQKASLSYIANVLRGAGLRVDFNNRYVDPWMEEPYASRLEGLLQFHDFDNAETALRKLDEAYREYLAASDRAGASLVRSLMVKGKLRAESLASNRRVSPEKRREKEEIALWFKIWLDLPDGFFAWLELRKRSEEFRQTFLARNGKNDSAAENR
jgi:hypothetical protein